MHLQCVYNVHVFVQLGGEKMGNEPLACKITSKFLTRFCDLALAYLAGLIFYNSHFSLYVLAIPTHLPTEHISLPQSHAVLLLCAHSCVNAASPLSSPKQLRPSPLPMLQLHPIHASRKVITLCCKLSNVFSQYAEDMGKVARTSLTARPSGPDRIRRPDEQERS